MTLNTIKNVMVRPHDPYNSRDMTIVSGITLSYMMVYIVDHTSIGLPMVSHTVHLSTLSTIISSINPLPFLHSDIFQVYRLHCYLHN